MKDSPLVHTSTGTSFEGSSATGDAVNLYITDVTFSAITATTAVAPHTTDAETQIDPIHMIGVHLLSVQVVYLVENETLGLHLLSVGTSSRFSQNK